MGKNVIFFFWWFIVLDLTLLYRPQKQNICNGTNYSAVNSKESQSASVRSAAQLIDLFEGIEADEPFAVDEMSQSNLLS